MKFKVGEQMLCCEDAVGITRGKIYIATSNSDAASVYFRSDVGTNRMRPIEYYKKVKPWDGFVIGATVERTIGYHGGMKVGNRGVITVVRPDSIKVQGYPKTSYAWHAKASLKVVPGEVKIVKEGDKEVMLKVIRENFEKTEDACLVQKHLGGQITDNFIGGLVIAANKEAILVQAKFLEKEAKAREKAC